MTATTATTILSLPRNKTGLFAADTLQEVKSTRSQPTTTSTIPRQSRNPGLNNLLLASYEQNCAQTQQYRLPKNEIHQYHQVVRSDGAQAATTYDSYLTRNGIRNGFRPSPLRRQKLNPTNSLTHRDLKDSSLKQSFVPSQGPSKLKSEIDQINSKLKIHGDVKNFLRLPHNRDTTGSPRSALSFSTSCRLSSASTNYVVDRIHQRFPSAMTNGNASTTASTQGTADLSNKSIHSLSRISVPTPPIIEEDGAEFEIDHHVTHAYQIPQQSNVGSESIFPVNPPPSPSSFKTGTTRSDNRLSGNKSVSCPFYVMYFTNLTLQQHQNNTNYENDKRPLILSATSVRKGAVSARINTSTSRRQSTKRHIQSPLSTNTHSNTESDDSTINTTSYYNNKLFSAKIAAFEKENSSLLKDVLRTTSWNHVQV